METRKIELTHETASRWYNGSDAELKSLAVQTFPELAKKELPKTWEGMRRIKGWYVGTTSGIFSVDTDTFVENKNIFTTKEQAEAAIALAQLTQLREVYRDGWVPDWTDDQVKYCIINHKNQINKALIMKNSHFLSFQDDKKRDLFLENFRDLIEKASPLLF